MRKVAEERVGELTDALLDTNLDYTVRRRLARVFAVCVSQRTADGLVLVLVRDSMCASREAAVGRPVWKVAASRMDSSARRLSTSSCRIVPAKSRARLHAPVFESRLLARRHVTIPVYLATW
jgi:hypothetical protein